MKIKISSLTHKGNYRKNNQDYLGYSKSVDDSFLAILCDGMGGHAKGEIASKTAVETFIERFENETFNNKTEQEINQWFDDTLSYSIEAMKKVANNCPKLSDMGTTLSAIIFTNNKAYVINIGDSRVYKFSDNRLKQITVDQNLMNSNYDPEKIKERAQKLYGSRFNEMTYWKILTSALGPNKKMKPDNYVIDEIQGVYCLTSDGVHDYVDSQTFVDFLEIRSSLKTKTKNIVKFAMGNLSTDNLSIIIIEVK
ncbi:PP2C family protein-serine/threonine phosphatase [Mycoplasma yeatsii]|uniref:PP2C family protein-serine/threonine phosphatase n=1 Tax=Mycoplasma yeatsii TaxID=51365 RepID=UPI0005B250F5|nr:PP2C family serine/threonine-protein phosphatase [Mycoplasma yeatsii]AJM72024.1 protein phosphatase [Mycoplasma yeatsii GM274B]